VRRINRADEEEEEEEMVMCRYSGSRDGCVPSTSPRLLGRTLLAIAYHLRELHHLNLRYLPRITDVGVEAIISSLHNLRSLNLSHCPRLTCAAVSKLGRNPACRMEVLRLWDCKAIQPGALLTLVGRLGNKLREIDVRGCSVHPGMIHRALEKSSGASWTMVEERGYGMMLRQGWLGEEKQSVWSDDHAQYLA